MGTKSIRPKLTTARFSRGASGWSIGAGTARIGEGGADVAKQRSLLFGNPDVPVFHEDERALRQRQYLLRTFSERHEGAYQRPAVRQGDVCYEAYWRGFTAGAGGEAKVPYMDYESDQQVRYLHDGFRIGALFRPTTIQRATGEARTD